VGQLRGGRAVVERGETSATASGGETERTLIVAAEHMEALTGFIERIDAVTKRVSEKVDRGFARIDARFDGVDRELALGKDATTVHDREIRGIRGKR
jgi:hypothetical protein